jgi:nucleotide-binding universal stress UspA family protein
MKAVATPILPAMQWKNILYATDFSEASRAAIPFVAAIARRYGSKVFAAHVWAPLPYSMVSPGTLSVFETKEESDAREALEKFINVRELQGLSITMILKGGNAVTELSHVVRQQRIDLVILSTHGRTGFKRLLMGSTAEELFRSLPCPVLTVGQNIARRFDTQSEITKILFPTDLSHESGAVFPYLAALAGEFGASITLLHVAPWDDHRHPAAMDEPDSLRSAMYRMFCSQLDPCCEASLLVEAGDPVERILSHAHMDKFDLIGFGVRKAEEITTHFRNTIPYKVVLESECPVLISHFGDS